MTSNGINLGSRLRGPLFVAAIILVHSRREDETARERFGHPTSYAEAASWLRNCFHSSSTFEPLSPLDYCTTYLI